MKTHMSFSAATGRQPEEGRSQTLCKRAPDATLVSAIVDVIGARDVPVVPANLLEPVCMSDDALQLRPFQRKFLRHALAPGTDTAVPVDSPRQRQDDTGRPHHRARVDARRQAVRQG